MPNFTALQASARWASFSATPTDADGIKTSIATDNTGANTYSGGALNGVVTAGAVRTVKGISMTVSVTTSVQAATYQTGASYPIVFTGTYAGKAQTESLLLTNAGGGETIEGTKPFDTVTSIAVPQQLTAAGAFTFGVVDPCVSDFEIDAIRSVRCAAAGNLVCVRQDGVTVTTAFTAGETHPIEPARIDVSASDAIWALTIYQ